MPQTIDVSPAMNENGHSLLLGNGHSNGTRKAEGGLVMTDAMHYEQGAVFKPLWEKSQIDRREFVRLAMQTFKDLGYRCVHRTVTSRRIAVLTLVGNSDTFNALQAESGFTFESPVVSELRTAVLAGRWDAVEKLLIELPAEDIVNLVVGRISCRESSNSLIRCSIDYQVHHPATEVSRSARSKGYEEGVVDLAKRVNTVESRFGTTSSALEVRSFEPLPSSADSNTSSLIMCGTPEDLRSRASWDGVAGSSRTDLLAALQRSFLLHPRIDVDMADSWSSRSRRSEHHDPATSFGDFTRTSEIDATN